MTTYWVLGKKGTALHDIPQHVQAGVPDASVPSLSRQTSQHSSLAAVVFGMMQANRRSTRASSEYFVLCFFFYIVGGVCSFTMWTAD